MEGKTMTIRLGAAEFAPTAVRLKKTPDGSSLFSFDVGDLDRVQSALVDVSVAMGDSVSIAVPFGTQHWVGRGKAYRTGDTLHWNGQLDLR